MDTTRLDRLKERFLLAAAKGGRLEEVLSLLELGADSENCLFGDGEQGGQDEEGIEEEGNDTPLIAAARAGHAEIVSVLLANGANPNAKLERGDCYALHAAAEQGHVEVYCLLVAHGALEQLENDEGLTARQVAQRNGYLRRILRGLRKAEGKDDCSHTDGSCSQCTDELDEGEDEAEDANENDESVDESGSLYSHILTVDSHEQDVEEESDTDGDSESSCSDETSIDSDSSESSDDSSRTSVASDRAISGATTDVIVVGMSHGGPSRTTLSRTEQDDAREVAAGLYLPEDGLREVGGESDAPRSDTSTAEEPQEYTGRDDAHLAAASGNAYMQTLSSNVQALQSANTVLEEDKKLLIAKLMHLKRSMKTAVYQKEMALEYGRVSKAKYRQARKEKEEALVRAQAAESNQFERLFGIGTDYVVSSASLSLQELESMEVKLRRALDAVVEAKETHLRRRLEQQDTEKACVICLEAPKTVLLLPCSHLCVCSNCSERAELVNCPLCRNDIESMIKTFA